MIGLLHFLESLLLDPFLAIRQVLRDGTQRRREIADRHDRFHHLSFGLSRNVLIEALVRTVPRHFAVGRAARAIV